MKLELVGNLIDSRTGQEQIFVTMSAAIEKIFYMADNGKVSLPQGGFWGIRMCTKCSCGECSLLALKPTE